MEEVLNFKIKKNKFIKQTNLCNTSCSFNLLSENMGLVSPNSFVN